MVSKRTFNHADHVIVYCLWRWARRRHPNKNPSRLKSKYFERYRGRDWNFFGKHVTTRGHRIKCGCCPPVARPLNDTSRSRPKLTRTILPMKLTSRNAKEIIGRKHFGVLALFASAGMNKPDSAPYAMSELLGSRVGGSTIASLVCWVVQRVLKTASYFTQSATTRFIANIFPSRNRLSTKEAFEGLELCAGKLARVVLRGPDGRKAVRLLGWQEWHRNRYSPNLALARLLRRTNHGSGILEWFP